MSFLTSVQSRYSVVIVCAETQRIKIYRGESSSSENRGKGGIGYWSIDADFAVQFTQTGQMHEVMVREVSLAHIYDATKEGKKLPSANSENEFDLALQVAKEKGFYGVRFSEGNNQPDSFYIFNKNIFKRSGIESANESPIVEFHPSEKGSRSGSHEIWVTFPNGTKYIYAVEESYAREKHGKTWKQLEGYLKGRESERISKEGKRWKKEGDVWSDSISTIDYLSLKVKKT